MKKITIGFVIVALYLISSMNANAQKVNADDVLGLWWNEEKTSKIEIYKKGTQFFGKLAHLTEPIDPDTGKPKLDKDNPEESLRNRPLLGLNIIRDFEFDADDQEWIDGEIYDPKSGNTYNCYMEFEDPSNKNILKVRGYIGYAFLGLGRTTYWTRVTE
jgi:uncharacterized protein (DUF2147 family)